MTTQDFARIVSFELRDLPWKMRRNLISELQGHLSELPEETDLVARLGTPTQYAADMRAAAGLERQRGVIAFLRARRLRNLIAVAVLLAATGFAIYAVVWINSYQPIVPVGLFLDPPDSKPTPGENGVTVVFRKGHPFEYGFAIHNDDRFAVRILGFPRSHTDFWVGHLLMSTDQSARMDQSHLERFHPFDMKPGSFRWFLIKGVYACTTGAGRNLGVTWVQIPIRFKFLWRTATAWIPLGDPVSFSFPKACPPPAKYR